MKINKIAAFVTVVIVMMMYLPLGASAASGVHFTVSEVQSEGNSTIIYDGQKWYKVNDFDDDKEYIITVKNSHGEKMAVTIADDENSSCIWNYYRQTMVASSTPRYTTLTTSLPGGFYYLVCSGEKVRYAYTRSVSGDLVWDHYGSTLRYNEAGTYSYLKYDEESDEPLSFTSNQLEAAEVDIYTNGDQLERCIISQPHAANYVIEDSNYTAPVFNVGLGDVHLDSIKWYVDNELQSCSEMCFTADVLKDKKAGVHRVYCLVEASDDKGIRYRERSEDALFVIAKGVVPDSVMTFSDIHEEYYRIGDAIGNIIERTGGYIPSLVICTGDFVNGPKAETDIMMSRYYPRIVAELGGLDAVFVSGNHDSGEAASAMSSAADLGANDKQPPSGGQIFNGRSDAVSSKGRNSLYARNIIVYGMNQESVMIPKDGTIDYTYKNVIGDIRNFLDSTAKNYHGELVIISAHTGLHALGIDPASVNRVGMQLSSWIGENQYNIDKSYELAALINSYAKNYNMDIMYLFGHDHSRGEAEMFLTSGDELVSPKSYKEITTDKQTIDFTYAHAGYLSTSIGSADTSFSFIYRDGNEFEYDLIRTSDNYTRHTVINAKNVPEVPVVTTTSTTSATTSTSLVTTSAISGSKTDNPKTGDSVNAVFFAVPVLLLLLSRKKKR